MLISLTDVKINNDYTYIKNIAPTTSEKAPDFLNGDTWLNTTNGFSYELKDQVVGTWIRIENDKEAKIILNADNTLMVVNRSICNFFKIDRNEPYDDLNLNEYRPDLSNWTNKDQFELQEKEAVFSQWTFEASSKTITVGDNLYGTLDNFKSGDLIFIPGSRRNNGYYTIDSITNTVITVNENITDDVSYAMIFLCEIPQSYKNIVGRMIHYDIYERYEIGQGMKSEKWGTYSYTRDVFDNGLKYPDQVIAGLDFYKLICTGGESVFID